MNFEPVEYKILSFRTCSFKKSSTCCPPFADIRALELSGVVAFPARKGTLFFAAVITVVLTGSTESTDGGMSQYRTPITQPVICLDG